ncbi:hypothetical protein [Zhongshania sp.]|uniref:hypothetical protein n=1 Tax=Zhongshania sp. TaxID=1971902 RepID=UPI001B75B31A|nr:hypothetical protein [Zhongshania sp.]MBQ0794491.1 hypothetical protein [Zhongshania sp.]
MHTASLGFALLGNFLSSALRASPYGSPKGGDQVKNFDFLLAQKKVSKEKRHPASPSMAKNAIETLRASQVTARAACPRKKHAYGSNSFPLNPLPAAVLSGAEGIWASAESSVVLLCSV